MRGLDRRSSGMTTGWAQTHTCILGPIVSGISILPCLLLLLTLHLPHLLVHRNMFSKYFSMVAACGLSYHLINLPTSLLICLNPNISMLLLLLCTTALNTVAFCARLGLLFMTVVRLVSLNKKNFNMKRERVVFMVVVPVILVSGVACTAIAAHLEVVHGEGWGVWEIAQFSIVDVLISILIICASVANLKRLRRFQKKLSSGQKVVRWGLNSESMICK